MSSNNEIRALERDLAHLLNKHLQTICQSNGLRSSGVKAELQNRIKNGKLRCLRDPGTSDVLPLSCPSLLMGLFVCRPPLPPKAGTCLLSRSCYHKYTNREV